MFQAAPRPERKAAEGSHASPVARTHEPAPIRDFRKPLFLKSAILFLLLGVAGLSTFAKVSQYYPRSNSAHYVSIANKMNVGHPPAVLMQKPLHPVARIAPPQPAFRTILRVEPEIPTAQQIGLVVSLQHRSPPSLLS
jgi:hypothetical protein